MQKIVSGSSKLHFVGIDWKRKFRESLQSVSLFYNSPARCPGFNLGPLFRKDLISTAVVAVKIIDIDEGDTLNPRLADTYSEFMKEVNALKLLSETKARNINHVIEALPVGKAMWMITEYCGGGSISTLVSSFLCLYRIRS